MCTTLSPLFPTYKHHFTISPHHRDRANPRWVEWTSSRVGSESVEFADQFKDASSKYSRADGHETDHPGQALDIGDGLGQELGKHSRIPRHI